MGTGTGTNKLKSIFNHAKAREACARVGAVPNDQGKSYIGQQGGFLFGGGGAEEEVQGSLEELGMADPLHPNIHLWPESPVSGSVPEI